MKCLLSYYHGTERKIHSKINLVILGLKDTVCEIVCCFVSGRQGPVQGNTEALATVTGIVDGTGSAGAAIGQVSICLTFQLLFYIILVLLIAKFFFKNFIHIMP